MVNCVKFVLALLGSHNQSVSTLGDQKLTIDIDEKWFYMVLMKEMIRIYILRTGIRGMTQPRTSLISRRLSFCRYIGKPHILPDGTELMAKLVSYPLLQM